MNDKPIDAVQKVIELQEEISYLGAEHKKDFDVINKTVTTMESYIKKLEKEVSKLKVERNAYRHREKVAKAELKWFKEESQQIRKEVEWLMNAIKNGPLEDLDITNIKKRFARWLPEKESEKYVSR